MIPTITDYRPGIYAELLQRAADRAESEDRWRRRIDFAADCILGQLALGWLIFLAWLACSYLWL